MNIYIDKLKTKSQIFNNQKQKEIEVNLRLVKEAELKNLERDMLIQNNLQDISVSKERL